METAKERPEKDPAPIGDPVPEPAPRDDVLAKASPVRCPFCHSDVRIDADAWVACRGCLARHHAPCWQERGACSACGTTTALSPGLGMAELGPRAARPPRSRAVSLLAFALVAFIGLFGVLLLGAGAWLGTARRRVDSGPSVAIAEAPRVDASPVGGGYARPAGSRYWDAIRACEKIPHSSDRADALCAIAEKQLANAELMVLLEQARLVQITSDRARVLSAILRGASLTTMDLASEQTYVDAALELSHSTEQAAALIALLQARPLYSSTRSKITDQLERVAFSDDRKRVIEALVEFPPRD